MVTSLYKLGWAIIGYHVTLNYLQCAEKPCGEHGDCLNLPGSHSCQVMMMMMVLMITMIMMMMMLQCHPGFEVAPGGSECADIDEARCWWCCRV